MAITSMGIGSGIDIKSLVDQLVAAEAQPAANRLARQESKFQGQLSALGSLKGALSSFKSSLSGLTALSGFNQRSATSTNEELFTVTANGSAVPGNYQVEVLQLAKAQSLRSKVGFDSSTASVGTGTLTFQFGDASKPAQTITIDAANDSLEGIRDAVNAAKIGVQASIVKGDKHYLVFSSEGTGEDNSLKISVEEDAGAPGLATFAYAPGVEGDMEASSQAQNAQLKINGVLVSRATNTIDDAIEGLTITLKKESEPGVTAGLSVALDKGAATKAVEGFVTAYNSLMGTVKSLSGYDAQTQKGGVLIGDSSVRSITNQIRNILGNTVAGLTGSYRSLADIGIKTKTDGTLELDKTKLDKALTDNFDDIGRLFAAAGKPNDAQVRFDSATANTKEGGYDVVVTRLASSGMYTDPDVALGAWPVIVDDSNDTFTIKVDGVTSGILSLGQRAYADGEELAAELQSRINGDSALQEAGVSVGVAFENGRFVFTSERIGAGSSVEILSVEDATASAGIGLTVKAEARIDGEDVAGTIGGVAALGNGIYLTGKGDADGLKIAIEGAATGNRGTVVFSRGVADKLNSLFDKLLDGESFLNQRTESLNDSIEDIGDQREALERRLESVQQRYMAQFTAMDALIAQLNSTGSFLTQRLASLNTSSQ